MFKWPILFTLTTLLHPAFGQSELPSCRLNLEIDEQGNISGVTDSKEVSPELSHFKVYDDDGYISQLAILNKNLKELSSKKEIILTQVDQKILNQAISRGIDYSKNFIEKANAGKYKSGPALDKQLEIQKTQLATYQTFQSQFASKKTGKFKTAELQEWRKFLQAERNNHFFKLSSEVDPKVFKNINICSPYPDLVPRCCVDKHIEYNNILAMSLCGVNFETGAPELNVHRNSKPGCSDYKVEINDHNSREKIQGTLKNASGE